MSLTEDATDRPGPIVRVRRLLDHDGRGRVMHRDHPMASLIWLAVLGISSSGPPPASAGDAGGRGTAEVKVLATPEGGLQPQAVIDDRGVIHLVYFKGDPA